MALALICAALFLRKRRRGLLSAALLLAGSFPLPQCGQQMIYWTEFQIIREASQAIIEQVDLYPDKYILFSTFSVKLLLAAVVLSLLCLAPALVGLRQKEPPKEPT